MNVYVRWYANILEGELLEGEHMGMKQVRIPLDGHKVVALFTPGHIYKSVEQIQEIAKEVYTYPKEFPKPSDIIHINSNKTLPADDQGILEAFKTFNWDHERNHLRIDKLEEFYQLWRMVMKPDGFVEAEALVTCQLHTESQPTNGAVPKNGTPTQQPQSHKSEKPKPSKKMLRSTGQQDFGNTIQLSIFD